MIDNKKVKEKHQEGIERVKQHKGEKGRVGHHGKMEWSPKEKGSFHREKSGMTPRKG